MNEQVSFDTLTVLLTGDERNLIVELLRSHPIQVNDRGWGLDIESLCESLQPECPICGHREPHVCRESL